MAQYVHEEQQDSYYYDPTNITPETNNHKGYPANINLAAQIPEQEVEPCAFDLVKFDVVHPSQPTMETQVYATSQWHRIIHQDINPMHLRPYLEWIPLSVVKKTLQNTAQMARMIIRYPLKRHVKSRFPHRNVT